ncbi:MAG: ester cyclase [Chloroflexi bacterium]|nr:ester cyclase [Chloroflexota bacterium]
MAEQDAVGQPEAEPNGVLSVYNKGDISNILPPADSADQPTDARLPLAGFDAEFTDIVQYIITVTHRIWEEQAVGYIYHYYKHNTVVHTSDSDIYGRERVVVGTLQALAAFPDRRLYGDDVIWGREPDGAYYSSHRITHAGRNSGHSIYGPPTNRQVRYSAIADCLVKANQIIEEWLVRDELLLINQLGLDAHALARSLAEAEAHIGQTLTIPGEAERLRGQLPPTPAQAVTPDDDLAGWVRAGFHAIWNWRLLNTVDDYYAETLVAQSASGRWLHGRGSYKAYVLSLLAAFPDLVLRVEHVCAIPESDGSMRVAVRWRMQGTHTGPGVYGKPTGKPIQIIGITHQQILGGRVVQEWTLFDEFALLKQLYAPIATDRVI